MAIAFRGLALVVIGLIVESAWGQTSPSVADILQMVRAGGYVIVFRHGATYPDQADTDPLHDDNIAKQRQLNDQGRADAKEVGEVFSAAGVPIGKSYSSRFYRAAETARLIGGKAPEATLDVTEGGLVVSPNENNRRAQAFGRSSPPCRPRHEHADRDPQAEHPRRCSARTGSRSRRERRRSSSPRAGAYALIARVQIGQWATAKK